MRRPPLFLSSMVAPELGSWPVKGPRWPVVLVADCRAVGFFAMAMRPSAGMMVPAGKV